MARKTKEELQEAFEAKLKKEWGRDDIVIDWSTHRYTAPVYLRAGNPSTCTHFVDIRLKEDNRYGKFTLLLYRSLKDYLRKQVHFYIFRESASLQIVCEIYPTTEVIMY